MGDPTETVQQIVDSGRRVRFGKGVVSKTTYVAAGVIAIWAIVVWRLSENAIANLFLVGAALVATAFAIWFVRGTQAYAQKNPAQAMLEGVELLEWQRLDLAAKGIGTLPTSPPVEGFLSARGGSEAK